MKKFLLPLLLFLGLSPLLKGQQQDQKFLGQLTTTCANATTACTTTTSTLSVPIAQYRQASISASGTYSGSTINFELSDDGGVTWYKDTCTRTDTPVQEISEALASNAVEMWNCGLGGTNFRVRQSAFGAGTLLIGITIDNAPIEPAATVAFNTLNPGNIGNVGITNTPGSTDPCQNPSVVKNSTFLNITTATTTAVVVSSGSTVVSVCEIDIVMTGTTSPDTLLLEDGTGAACVTTQIPKTPTFSSGVLTSGATAFHIGYGGTLFKTAASGEVCAVSTVATGPTISLFVTFVQQ